jgi:NAD(P)-dependent dehydrogenase (short-subunit alcohol dehydrogenase family)
MDGFAGRVVVVTGGASGIGAACARRFAAGGARVVVADVQDDRGRQVAGALGGACAYRRADVSSERDVAALFEHVLELHGRIDCLVGSAGVAGPDGPIASLPLDTWDAMVGVMLRGAYLGTRFAAPAMIARRSGCIVHVAGVAGVLAGFGSHVYSAAQAAVIQLTRSVAMELAEHGVRVNCVCPGPLATPLHAAAAGLDPDQAERSLSGLARALADAQPIPRAGTAEDVAEAVAWLASDAAAFVTGHALAVDGGLGAGRPWRRSQAARAAIVDALAAACTGPR